MGCEHVLHGSLRSSVELRRIRNARATAVRHRMWQEVRFQREQEEKKEAKEILERRRKERAQLATYIYTSAQNADKGSHNRWQSNPDRIKGNEVTIKEKKGASLGHDAHARCKDIPEFYNHGNMSSHETLKKVLKEKDCSIEMVKECSYTSMLLNENPMDDSLPIWSSQEECKQLDHQNSRGLGQTEEKADNIEDIQNNSRMNEWLHADSEVSVLDIEMEGKLELRQKDDQKQDIFQENQMYNRTGQKANGHYQDSVSDSQMNDGLVPHQKGVVQTMGVRQEINREKCKAWEIIWTADPQCLSSQNSRTSHNVCPNAMKNENTSLDGSSMALCPSDQRIFCTYESLPHENTEREPVLLHSNSQQSANLEAQGSCLIMNRKEYEQKPGISLANNTKYQCVYEPVTETEKIGQAPLCCPRPLNIQSEKRSGIDYTKRCSQLEQAHRLPRIGHRKERLILCRLRNRKKTRLLGLSEEEKSLLASIERLDVKLATVAANMPESSRNSLISEEQQSIKSAPPLIKRKTGNGLLSVNSNQFPSRPLTSHSACRHICQSRVFSVGYRRRQNVGLTNTSKERDAQFQTHNQQSSNESQAFIMENHKQGRHASDGRIVIHQNAQFLLC